MNPIIKNILAIVLGIFIGSSVNMGIIMISGSIIPPPNGADVTTIEGLKESISLFQWQHFIFPFLAHALGTLVGAFVAAMIAAKHKMRFAFAIGIFFLMGGIANAFMLPSPIWFILVDLAAAYIPMSWIGWGLAKKYQRTFKL